MNEVTFLLYVDALRYDYISEKYTPFLAKLCETGFFSRIRTSPGFTQEATLMTGRYPDETGYFTWYKYAPKESPFRWLHPFTLLNVLRKSKLYYPVKVGIRTITKLITANKYPDPSFIPLDLLHYFTIISSILPKHVPTLSSICEDSGHTCYEHTLIYKFIGSANCRSIFTDVLDKISKGHIFDLYLIHIGELDGLGHRFGPHPELFREHLRDIDAWIQKLYISIKKKGFDCNLVITSDHGMMDVEGTINVEDYLRRTCLKVPRDYIYFLDSTIARFWFSNDDIKNTVRRTLEKIPHGHILSSEERTNLHINFENDEYGQLLFWVDKGYMIFPNFFQSFGYEKTKGMHGYMNDMEGGLIVYSDDKSVTKIMEKSTVSLVDVFGITRTLAGL